MSAAYAPSPLSASYIAPAPSARSVSGSSAPPLARAKRLQSRATEHFLHHGPTPTALLDTHAALALLAPLPPSPSRDTLLSNAAVLRLTLLSALHAAGAARQAECGRDAPLFALPAPELLAKLCAEHLQLFHPAPGGTAPCLAPTPATHLHLLSVPLPLLSALLLLALALPPPAPAAPDAALHAARSLADWYLSALAVAPPNVARPPPEAHTAFVTLYALHILGARAHEWELAASVAHGELDGEAREALLAQLSHAHTAHAARPERLRTASSAARATYEREKARRAAEAESAAAATASGSSRGARDDKAGRAATEQRRPALPSRSSSSEEQMEQRISSRRSSSASASGRPSQASLTPPASSSVARVASSEQPFAAKRGAISDYLAHLSPVPASASGSVSRTSSGISPMVSVLLRTLSGAALLGLLLGMARALAALRRAQSLRGATQQVWQRLANTIGMGMRVTYL